MGNAPVTPSVGWVSNRRLAYEDALAPTELLADCAAVGRKLRPNSERAVGDTGEPGKQRTFRRYGLWHGSATIVVPDDVAALAHRMELPLR